MAIKKNYFKRIKNTQSTTQMINSWGLTKKKNHKRDNIARY